MEAKDGEEQELDLFGRPVRPLRDPRGRPSFARSKENQELVRNCVAAGMKQGAIATVLGCDEKTLRKHFSRELHDGVLVVQAEAMSVLVAKMRQGHVTAAKQILDRTSHVVPPVKPSAKDEPKGKKEQAAEDAKTVPRSWSEVLGRSGDEPLN